MSFKLAPQFNDNDELEAVCVTDLQSAENIVFDNNNGIVIVTVITMIVLVPTMIVRSNSRNRPIAINDSMINH